MGSFKRLTESLAFTKNEQTVFLFLTTVFLSGVAVQGYKNYIGEQTPVPFDSAAQDSVFLARSASATDSLPPAAPKIVNINTASKQDLMTLPGIGEAMAERIMLRRNEKGRFRTPQELRTVKGIGEKKLEKLLPLIEVK